MRTELLSLIAKKMNVNGLKSALLVTALLMFGGVSWGQGTEGFESYNESSYYTGTSTIGTGDWDFVSVFKDGAANSGSVACRINDDVSGASITTPSLNTVGTVTFWYRPLNAETSTFQFQKSVGGGAFTTIESISYGSSQSYVQYSYDVNEGNSDVKIRILNDDQSAHLIIDDFEWTAYSAGPSAPTATTDAATSITTTGATLNGTINDNGANVTSIVFKYGTSLGGPYGTTVNATPNTLASGSGEIAVTKALTGLTTGQTYYYVVEATNSEGTTTGAEQSFTPSASPIKILFDASSAQSEGSADWVIDADSYDVAWNSSGVCYSTSNDAANAQQIPTPSQATITGEGDWTGANSRWAYECVQLGYTVESYGGCQDITYGDAGNPQDLSNYDVFICNEPNVQFTAAEKTAIIDFVNAGGGLYMGADHGGTGEADRNGDGWNSTEIWNDLMSTDPFGIQFNHDNTNTTTSSNTNADASDPILHGTAGDITSISFNDGATLSINSGNNATAKGAVFVTGEPLSSSNNIMVAYASYGSGRVVGVGDSSPTGDGSGDPSKTHYNNWDDNNNGTLIMNATIWLVEGSTRLVVSPSSLTGFTYEEGSGSSANQSFSLDGYGLVGSGDITVTGSTNYEVSTDGTTFAGSVTYPYASGEITSQPQTVYVRLKAGLSAGDYNAESITVSGGSASAVNVTCSGSVTAPSSALFCDDFEDDLSDWTVTNDSDPGAQVEISSLWGGANATSNAALYNAPNPASITYYTSTIEKTFTNSKDLSIEFYYYFEDYRGGEVNVKVNSIEVYSIYTETAGDQAITASDDDLWTFISLDLSSQTSTFDDYTITIEGVAKTSSTWQDRVAVDEVCVYGTQSLSPTLTASESTLAGFTYEEGNGPSAEQSFDLSGLNLDGSDVTVTPPTNFEISETSGSGFQSSAITLSAYNGSAKTIYVRLKSGLVVNTYGSENIQITGGGATAINVACSGEVTAPDVTAPSVTTYSPADNATDVAIDSDLVLTFDENVQVGTGNIVIYLGSDDSEFASIDVTSGAVTVSGNQVTINPSSDFATLTEYYVLVDNGAIEDLSNNDYSGISSSTTWNFTTADVVSTTTCIDEDFDSGLTGYVTGNISLTDGNWLADNGGYPGTTSITGKSCQIKKESTAFIATPVLYNAQSVTFWWYHSDVPIVKYGSTTLTASPVAGVTANTWNEYTVDISASTSERIYFYGNTSSTSYLENVSTICEAQPCVPPVISSQPSTATQNVCKSAAATALSVTASPVSSYQWYSNTTASNSGGSLIGGATSSSYIPSTSNAGTLYYYCVVYNEPPTDCSTTSDVSGAVIVTANPVINEASPSVCDGANITLTSNTSGGTWTSDDASVATINSSTGEVLGVDPGTCVITYTKNGCFGTESLTVETTTPTISGTLDLCEGSTTTLSGDPAGGTWSSATTSVATVNSSTGEVSGISAGTSVMTYTTTCGSNTETVTVTALPTISGDVDICAGNNTTLSGNPTGGTWASDNTSVATINASSGLLEGIAGGTATITYTANGCSITEIVTINEPSISGSTSVTIGGTSTLTGDPAGGTWSSATPSNVTVDAASGLVTGVADGTSLITYSVAGCDVSTTVTSSTGPCLGLEEFDAGASAPAGWTFTDITATYTSAAYYGDASPSIKLEDDDQIIETPTFTNASELSFYCYLNAGTSSELLIEGWDGSSWLTVDNNTNLPTSDATAYITYNASSTPALEPGFTKFRFTFTKESGNGAFDDVTVWCDPDFNEIGLEGNGNAIVDGDATPQAADFTDFGSVAVSGGTAERTFTIHNFGTQDLNLTGSPIVETTGDFTVTSQPSSSVIAGGSSLTFTVQFDPTVIGECTGTISILNDDSNESPYDFSVKGERLASASPWAIDEKFDGVSSMATITNTNTTGFTATGTGSISAATGNAQFNRSQNALTFLGSAGSTVTITTPTFSNADMLSFWYKQPDGNLDGTSDANTLLVEEYIPAKAGWTTLATIPGGAGAKKARVYFYALDPTATQARFTYTRANTGYQGYFDDVRVRKAGSCSDNIKIVQTLVQSCMGNEGINEAVIIRTGSNAVNVSDLSISFPNVGAGGTEYSMEADQTFTTNPAYVANINTLVQVSNPTCSPLLNPPSGIIPADSYAIIFAGSSPSVNYDLQSACASGTNYYAVFCDNTNTVGRYGNTPDTDEDNYTSIIDKASGCYDTKYYDEGIPNSAGALAVYDETSGARSYENFGCEILLPVELLSFYGHCQNDLIQLVWKTASEVNNDFFTVEASTDLVNWKEIVHVTGAGNSNLINEYSVDYLIQENRSVYFRLKQTDFNGDFVYHETIHVTCSSGFESLLDIYPNPAALNLNCEIFSEVSGDVQIQIINSYGQVVENITNSLRQGNNTIKLDIKSLSDGLYYLKCFNSNGVFIGSEKFVKQEMK